MRKTTVIMENSAKILMALYGVKLFVIGSLKVAEQVENTFVGSDYLTNVVKNLHAFNDSAVVKLIDNIGLVLMGLNLIKPTLSHFEESKILAQNKFGLYNGDTAVSTSAISPSTKLEKVQVIENLLTNDKLTLDQREALNYMLKNQTYFNVIHSGLIADGKDLNQVSKLADVDKYLRYSPF